MISKIFRTHCRWTDRVDNGNIAIAIAIATYIAIDSNSNSNTDIEMHDKTQTDIDIDVCQARVGRSVYLCTWSMTSTTRMELHDR